MTLNMPLPMPAHLDLLLGWLQKFLPQMLVPIDLIKDTDIVIGVDEVHITRSHFLATPI